MAYERKHEKIDLTHTEINTNSWKSAIDHVTMGVAVTPILLNQPTYDENGKVMVSGVVKNNSLFADETPQESGTHLAEYVTESGREGTFFMVMVDRHNTGDFKALAPCSDYYAAIPPADIYRSLSEMLEGSDATPTYTYNAYNGGQQLLMVDIKGLKDVTLDKLPGIKLQLVMKTSLDKTSNHAVSIRPVTEDGVPILFSDTSGHGYSFKIRHTTAAKAEIVNFNVAVAAIAQNWNNRIVPYVQFLANGDFEQSEVAALMANIVKDSKLPKDIAEEITSAFKTKKFESSQGETEAMRVISTISGVINDRDATPMTRQRDSDKVSKAITDNVTRLFNRFKSTS